MSETQQRQYRPLTGPEIIDYILAEFRKALVNSGELPLHRVFHELSFVGGVKIRGWGSKPVEARFSGSNGDSHPDDAVEVEASVTVKAEPEAPSLVRERLAGEQRQDATPTETPDVLPVSVVVDNPDAVGSVSTARDVDSSQNGFTKSEYSTVVADSVTAIDPLTCAKGCTFIAKSQAGKLAHERHCKGHQDVVD